VAEYGPEVLVPEDGELVTAAAPSPAAEISSDTPDTGDDTPQAEPDSPQDGPDDATGTDEAAEPERGKPFVRAEQEARLARAERKLGQLGRVNPLALEEFAAL